MALVVVKSSHVANGVPLCGGAMLDGENRDNIIPPIGVMHNIFDTITRQEASSGMIDYRCIYIYSTRDSSEPFGNLRIRINSEPETKVSIGVVSKGVPAEEISTEKTAPSGVTFYTQDQISRRNSSGYLEFPGATSFLPGEFCALWIKRECVPTAGSGIQTEELGIDILYDGS